MTMTNTFIIHWLRNGGWYDFIEHKVTKNRSDHGEHVKKWMRMSHGTQHIQNWIVFWWLSKFF